MKDYPFDAQNCRYVLSSTQYSDDVLSLSVKQWNARNQINRNSTRNDFHDTRLEILKHRRRF